MSVEHLDIVHKQLRELFATKELPENWDEGLIIVPVPDVERITKPEPLGLPTAPEDLREDNEADILEHFGEYVDQAASPVVPSPEIVQVLGGTHGGSPLPYTDPSKMPPPDCHAFYLPFHYFYPIWWGVYLLYEGVLWLRDEIIRRVRQRSRVSPSIRGCPPISLLSRSFPSQD
jgi:hypothetical protein